MTTKKTESEVKAIPVTDLSSPPDETKLGLWERFKLTFFYDENRIQLSRTAVMNFIFAMLATISIVVGLTGLIFIFIYSVKHPTYRIDPQFVNLVKIYFTIVGSLLAIASASYSYGKKIANETVQTTIVQK